jgi:hypothetical protein
MTHILRAHQLCMEGYASLFDNHLSTVWSAPNYCYRCGNSASILEVSPGEKMYFNVFEAAPENERDGPSQQQAAQTAGGKVRVTLFLGSILMAQRLTPLLPHSASRVFFVALHMRTRCPSRPMTTFVPTGSARKTISKDDACYPDTPPASAAHKFSSTSSRPFVFTKKRACRGRLFLFFLGRFRARCCKVCRPRVATSHWLIKKNGRRCIMTSVNCADPE